MVCLAADAPTPIRAATTDTLSPARTSAINRSRCSAVYRFRMHDFCPRRRTHDRWAWCSGYEAAKAIGLGPIARS